MNESNAISSKSTDFQPTTQNPQNNVAGGLQPNSANLQPVVDINQQAFPQQTTTLRVLNSQTGTLSAAVTTDQPPKTNSTGSIWIFLVVAVAVIIGLLLLAKAAKPAEKLQDAANDISPEPAESSAQKPKKKRSKTRRSRRRN